MTSSQGAKISALHECWGKTRIQTQTGEENLKEHTLRGREGSQRRKKRQRERGRRGEERRGEKEGRGEERQRSVHVETMRTDQEQ